MVSREWSGRKFNWYCKQLGLSKVELARQLGISHRSLYRCIWGWCAANGSALAIVGLWIPGSHGAMLEDRSEPEEGMTLIPKGMQGDRCAKKKELKFFVEYVTI